MVKSTCIAAAAASGLLACGGTSGSPPPQPDAGFVDRADAMAEVNTCVELEAAYGDLGAFTGEAVLAPINPDIPDGQQFLSLAMPMNEDSPPDVFVLELYSDSPPFEDTGFAPVSLVLNGDQSDLILCGACAYIAPDHEQGAFINFHMTYTGELELTAIDPTPDTGVVQGSLSNLKLHHVELDGAGTQTAVVGGCKTEIGALSFDFSVVAAPPEAP